MDPFEHLLDRLTSKRALRWAWIAYLLVNGSVGVSMAMMASETGSWQAFGSWLVTPVTLVLLLWWLRAEVAYRVARRDAGREGGDA